MLINVLHENIIEYLAVEKICLSVSGKCSMHVPRQVVV